MRDPQRKVHQAHPPPDPQGQRAPGMRHPLLNGLGITTAAKRTRERLGKEISNPRPAKHHRYLPQPSHPGGKAPAEATHNLRS